MFLFLFTFNSDHFLFLPIGIMRLRKYTDCLINGLGFGNELPMFGSVTFFEMAIGV